MAPIWSDLATFDGRPWSRTVDIITGGIPCQPFSVAGKRRRMGDPRFLWPDVVRLVEETGASLLFLEEVPGFRKHALPGVLVDLNALGFDAEWDNFRASDVASPHKRERFFLLAYHHRHGLQKLRGAGLFDSFGETQWDDVDRCRGSVSQVVDAASKRRGERGSESEVRSGRDSVTRTACAGNEGVGQADAFSPELRNEPGRRSWPGRQGQTESQYLGEELAHSHAERRHGRSGDIRSGRGTQSSNNGPFWPPGPDDTSAWRRVQELSQPAVCRVAHAGAFKYRVDRLRALGNAVVPQCAALAFRELAKRAIKG